MSRAQMTDEYERWTVERCIEKMERDVVRGNALQKLIADEKAAVLSQSSGKPDINEVMYGNNCER